MDEKPNEQQTNSSFKKLTTTKTISSPTSLSPSTATLKLKPSLLTPPTIDDYLPTDHPLLPSPTPSAKVLAQAASHSLDSTAENTFSPSSTSSSSFHPRATGYRHSFHRRHNSAKQRGHIGSNYPTYYNYRYDDNCSTDTIDKVETEIDQTLQLHAYDTPTSVLAARRLSKTPSPKPSNMYYDKQQRNSIFVSGNNGYNNATSNSSRTSFTGCNTDEQQIQQTAQQLEQQQQQQQQQIVLQQHQQLQRNRSRSRSNTISRENSRKSCCSKRPACNTNDINRRFSSTSSTTSQQLCCCDFDDEYDSDDARCRSAGFCGSVCTKTFLITINLTFFIIGCSMMAGGVWVHIYRETNHLGILLRDNPTNPFFVSDRVAVFLIVSGAIVSIIGFLGCCGACTESVCFLGFYTVLLLFFLIIQIILVVLATNYQERMESSLKESMMYQVKYEYNTSADQRMTSSWDQIQSTIKCCGVVGPLDYYHSLWFNSSKDVETDFVPESCCKPFQNSDLDPQSVNFNDDDHFSNHFLDHDRAYHSGHNNGFGGSFEESIQKKRHDFDNYIYHNDDSSLHLHGRVDDEAFYNDFDSVKRYQADYNRHVTHETVKRNLRNRYNLPSNNYDMHNNYNIHNSYNLHNNTWRNNKRQLTSEPADGVYSGNNNDQVDSSVNNIYHNNNIINNNINNNFVDNSFENKINNDHINNNNNNKWHDTTEPSLGINFGFPSNKQIKNSLGDKNTNTKKHFKNNNNFNNNNSYHINNNKDKLYKVKNHHIKKFSFNNKNNKMNAAQLHNENNNNNKTIFIRTISKRHARQFGGKKYRRKLENNKSPSSHSSSSPSSLKKGYMCQLDAMKFQFINDQGGEYVYKQGCHAAILELVKIHAPVLICIIFLDVLQIINLFYACVLIGIVRKKHSDYSWCEEEERI